MDTNFYERLRTTRGDDQDLAECVYKVVKQLEETSTSGDKPGMLLGKIQSGKTRGFVGVIAAAFDRGFDIAVILTKGTKTLSAQTVARLGTDFKEFIDNDEFLVCDIMQPPGKLSGSEKRRKIVIVAKKQVDNLRRLIQFFDTDYPEFKDKRLLLIDDEADLASIRFVRQKDSVDVDQGKIAEQIDELRGKVKQVAFLQVTATPYSLYLQPDDYTEDSYVYKPKKPAFTELLPIHSGYVGGDAYFGDSGEDDPNSYLFVEVENDEQDSLRKEDDSSISPENILEDPNAINLVRAIVTFILAVSIRHWQQTQLGEKKRKYAMIIHNDTQKVAHAWQTQVIDWVLAELAERATHSPERVVSLFDDAYADLGASIAADGGMIPDRSLILDTFIEALKGDEVVRETVNSDKDVMALLDEKAELRLRTGCNIFIGGNILDRGITIPNLISFYYGRNPRTMQADTVLQHSRMYGNRDKRDLAVTRFYTSIEIYNRLRKINSFENALRSAFENGAHDQGVVFIQADEEGRVRPCAPNKLLLSNVVGVKSSDLYLPTGFQTIAGDAMAKIHEAILTKIPKEALDTQEFISIPKKDILDIIGQIEKTLKLPANDFEWDAMRGLIDYYSNLGDDEELLIMAITGRSLDRKKSGNKSGLSILGGGGDLRAKVIDPTREKPALILLQQSGTNDLNWEGGYKFWWPILAAPGNIEACVFATKVMSA